MSDITDPLAWVERAEEDYEVARTSVRRKRPLTYSACFHAQQCAEKYLKAVLVARGATFSRVHDLVLLQNQCENAGVVVALDPKQLTTLTEYAVRVRYPGDDPTPEEARDAVAIAKTVRRFARTFLGLA
jgi:HEPN domain-containing protein